ncbi:MAG: sulfatase-like hydrolase/transferase [Deltaproteobacteria bacterium]|nr:sulfatase-like hydrolase/transferase [Deltaproteobacteria bacterium]
MKNNSSRIVLALALLVITGFVLSRGEKDIGASGKVDADSLTIKPMPNVIVILADDLGCGDISLYDGWVQTPRIDQMAREGVKFTDFHSNACLCSPTRAALLTGRYQQRVGIIEVVKGYQDKNGLEDKELTISRLMKQNGYKTAIFGKWHLGWDPQYNPIYHGFDEFIGFLPGGTSYLKHEDWRDGTEIKEQKGYSTHIITDMSVDFIKRNKNQPFFLYISHQAVHNYYQIPSDSIETKGRDIPLTGDVARARYKIILQELDKSVGKVMDTLRELKLEENTIVIFFSDNGDVKMGTNIRPYRGGKGTLYEGGHRIPAVIRWPGKIKAGWTSDELIVGMDILPTLMDILDIDIPKERKLDGISIKNHLLNQTNMPDRKVFFGHEPRFGTAMRDGHWKMMTRGDLIELYDLNKDIRETDNIADKYPERTKKMKADIEQWKMEVKKAE